VIAEIELFLTILLTIRENGIETAGFYLDRCESGSWFTRAEYSLLNGLLLYF